MADPVIVRVTHRYNVPAERVYDAWVTPSQAGRFLFATRTGTVLHCEMDARAGGEFTVTDRRPTADGDESFFDAQHRGTFIELDRPSRIVFDFSVGPSPDNATRVQLDFVPMGPQITELVVTHRLGEGDDARIYEDRTRQGWATMLAQLEKVLTARTWGVR